MREVGLALGAVLAAFVVSGCAHDPPPRPAVAEEKIVMAPAAADAKPIPEIDPNKPLAHANDVRIKQSCMRNGRQYYGGDCR